MRELLEASQAACCILDQHMQLDLNQVKSSVAQWRGQTQFDLNQVKDAMAYWSGTHSLIESSQAAWCELEEHTQLDLNRVKQGVAY